MPALGIAAIKAKLDTGARTSALHVESYETFARGGAPWVRFVVRPRRKRASTCEAPIVDRRLVTDSGGNRHERLFIETDVRLHGQLFRAEINLTDRHAMLFPMLIGRSALAGRFRVDPDHSYTCPKPPRAGEPPA